MKETSLGHNRTGTEGSKATVEMARYAKAAPVPPGTTASSRRHGWTRRAPPARWGASPRRIR